MKSSATTATQYLAELPADRRAAIAAVRKVILDNLDKDIEETMAYGMICYAIPHRVYPAGYHCDPKQPLPYAALASQKNYMSLYLDTSRADWFTKEWAKTGKKLDKGKVCIRFKKLEDLPLDLIGRLIRSETAEAAIAAYEEGLAAHSPRNMGKASRPAPSKEAATSKPAAKKATKKTVKKSTKKKVSR
ncbi:MAG TPA: DUF1801 domain-containing protein [Phycisphaerales bacterium]|nr:DUF1801 domain-containing protein [Phycisphaerales bacterium]